MSRLASLYDFEQGGLYSGYTDYSFFLQRADWVKNRFFNMSYLVAGCGWGYTVKYLLDTVGVNAWGIDASQYAIDKSKQLFSPEIYNRILLADCLNVASLEGVRLTMGLTKPNDKLDVGICEELAHICANDTEARAMRDNLRNALVGITVHVIPCLKPGDPAWGDPADGSVGPHRDPNLLWHTQAQWKTILGGDFVLDTETWEYI